MMEIQHNITYLLTAVPCIECTVYSVNSRPTRTQLVFEAVLHPHNTASLIIYQISQTI